jgi:hypothetical protein
VLIRCWFGVGSLLLRTRSKQQRSNTLAIAH